MSILELYDCQTGQDLVLTQAMRNPQERIFHWTAPRASPSWAHELADRLPVGIADLSALAALGAVYRNGDRLLADAPVASGDYFRIHLKPRRFAMPDRIIEKLIVWQSPDLIAAAKPRGLPTHATLDNCRENLQRALSDVLGPLWVTHRLDQFTAGLVLLARTQNAARLVHGWLKRRLVRKYYVARTLNAVPLGEHRHFMKPSASSPKIVSSLAHQNWRECRLIVHSTESRGAIWESSIELLTGRTHQIRAQLAALGSPLIHDPIYGGSETAGTAVAPLLARRIEWPGGQAELSSQLETLISE